MARTIILGSRASALALAQTNLVLSTLQAQWPGRAFEVRHISTQGDRVLDRPLTAIGGRGVFVREIEDALLAGDIDIAVHSFKNISPNDPTGRVGRGCCDRAGRSLRRIGGSARHSSGRSSYRGTRGGTSSRRRSVQLLSIRPDLVIADIRGNVNTRVCKLDDGQYDATVLAAPQAWPGSDC